MPAPGRSAPFSPTRLTAVLAPAATVVAASSRQQYLLPANDGTTWVPIDSTNLSKPVNATGSQTAVIGGNADLWTTAAGYNQDLGISVDGGAPIAWKESGGFAGTFSPNAAFVLATTALTAGPHTVTLVWKANKPVPANTVRAGAGPGTPYSPSTLTVRWLPSANVIDRVSQSQYILGGSDGAGWTAMDPQALSATFTQGGNCLAELSANADSLDVGRRRQPGSGGSGRADGCRHLPRTDRGLEGKRGLWRHVLPERGAPAGGVCDRWRNPVHGEPVMEDECQVEQRGAGRSRPNVPVLADASNGDFLLRLGA